MPEKHESLFIDEFQVHQRRYLTMLRFTHSATKAAGAMLLAAIVALIVANSGAYDSFIAFWHIDITIGFGDNMQSMSMAAIINDIFMAIFFLLVGLEIKYEMTVGELTNIRQALLPIVAACGGVLAPICVYSLFNMGTPNESGWGVPTATDIAFALGILALLGDRVPSGVRVFLSTLAVADDIIAILVIAVFYGHSPDPMWLLAAAVVFAVLIVLNRRHYYSLIPYLVVGVILWYCVFMSGVHSTIAGVLLALTIPTGSHVNMRRFAGWSDKQVNKAHSVYRPDEPIIGQEDYLQAVSRLSRVANQVVPPATRLERRLYPWVYFAILPLFALTNADVCLVGSSPADIFGQPVFFGVFFGLLVGKPVGIMLFSFIVVKTKLASLPQYVNWIHMLGASILGGVGFTMAIFVANLAFVDDAVVITAKAGILSASMLAGIIGFLLLMLQARKADDQGAHFVPEVAPDTQNRLYSDVEEDEARVLSAEQKARKSEASAEPPSDGQGTS